jgi:glutathione S-transferase
MAQPLTWDSAEASLLWDADALVWDGDVPNANTHTTMPNDNRISAEVTAANKTLIMTKVTEIKALLPFLANLTKDERIQLPKLGAASLEFDEQCASYMASAPNLVPPFVDVAEVSKDRALRLVLADLFREMKKLCEQLDDTLLLVGSEVWLADISFYQTVKQAARRDVLGADTIYDDLKARFPGVSGDPEEEPTPTP